MAKRKLIVIVLSFLALSSITHANDWKISGSVASSPPDTLQYKILERDSEYVKVSWKASKSIDQTMAQKYKKIQLCVEFRDSDGFELYTTYSDEEFVKSENNEVRGISMIKTEVWDKSKQFSKILLFKY